MKEYQAYYDAAGSESSEGPLVVAGIIARHSSWKRFDVEWMSVLKKYEIPYFHMQEFVGHRGAFKHWRGEQEKRAALLRELLAVVKRRINKAIIVGLMAHDFHYVNRHYVLDRGVRNAYSFVAALCATQVEKWFARRYSRWGLTHYFEEGDAGQAGFASFARAHVIAPTLIHPAKNSKGEWITPFQCADLIGWECAREWQQMQGPRTREARRSYVEIGRHLAPIFTVMSRQSLVDMCLLDPTNFPERESDARE